MQSIGISEAGIRPHIGQYVCAVMHDGCCIYGRLTECRDGSIFLDGPVPGEVGALTKSGRKVRPARAVKGKRVAKHGTKATVSGFGFFPGRGLGISLALLSLLFLIPFAAFPFFI